MFNLYNLISKIFNYDKDKPVIEDFDEIIKKLFRLRRIDNNDIINKKVDESKSLKSEITSLNKDLKISLEKNDRKFKLLSNKDGVIIWGHPDDPYDKNKQIRYYMQKDGSYSVSVEKNSNAYIIGDDVVIDVNNGYQNLYGEEKQFKLTANEKFKILFRESRKRFDDYFSNQNITLSRPFFFNDDQKELLTQIKSSDNKVKENAINQILFIAKNNENCFVPTYNNVPYYDKLGNIIFGFDDDRTPKRHYTESGSKYSLAYRINSNNPNKFEIIASEKTRDCYIMAIDKSNPNKEYFEILNIGNNPQNHKFITSDDRTAKFIDYNLAKNIDCPSLCALIRTQGKDPGIYGINIYNKIQKFLSDIEAYMLLKNYSEDQILSIKKALIEAINFKEGCNILKIFSSATHIEDFTSEIINQINSNQNIDMNKLAGIFAQNISFYENSEIKPNELYPHKIDKNIASKIRPKWPNEIKYDKNKFNLLCSFIDSNCKDEEFNNYKGKVFVFCKKNEEFDIDKKKFAHSFIVEVEEAKDNTIKHIRVRLGKESNNKVDTYIQYNNQKLIISNNEISFDKNSNIFKDTAASEYMCISCLDRYEEQNLKTLLDLSLKKKGRSK